MTDPENIKEQEVPGSVEGFCPCAGWMTADDQGSACQDMFASVGAKCKRAIAVGGVLAVLLLAGVVLLIVQIVAA